MVEKDNTDTPVLAMLMAATGVLMVLAILGVMVLFHWKQGRVRAEHEAKSNVTQGRDKLQEQGGSLPIEEGKKALLEKGL
ncbi:MAG: hypothetical protein GY930_13090 [bacterium]|nr:hypothetical protein [bacterium]